MTTRNVDPEFEELLTHLRETRGFDFSGYKRTTLTRRFQRRIQQVGVDSYAAYRDYLEVHPEEFGFLFDMILINVTEFFRDAPAWKRVAEEVVPQILARKGPLDAIRGWSAGCASGQEAYTVAMVLAETLGIEAFQERVKIYGTDIDEDALAAARHGAYSERELASVPDDLRERYFEQNGASLVFRKDLRRSVIFGRHDLTLDAPISRLDLLVCRNTLMYFNAETQDKILDRFHFSLRDGGCLFLGKAETLLAHSERFAPIDLKYRLFQRATEPERRREDLAALVPPRGAAERDPPAPVAEAAFAAGPLAQLVVDRDGVLIMANDLAMRIFRLAAGDVGRALRDLELSYRPVELRAPIDQVLAERRPITVEDVQWTSPIDGSRSELCFEIIPLSDPTGVQGALISVRDVTDVRRLEQELQSSNRQLETAYEELQSTNEELETTNEELQSTNEELETMNEELQSTNEEMHTVNEELRDRSVELGEVNGYLESILASLRAGVVVVDRDVLIRVWNGRSADLWGLRPEEVRGKNFLNLDIGLPVDALKVPIREVLAGADGPQEATLDAIERRGRSVTCQVTMTPLSADDGVRGVILLMDV